MSDQIELERLNQQYVAAFLAANTAWYRDHLADDFVCIQSDGTVVDKAAFLRRTAAGPDVADYRLVEVDVRVIGAAGDVALVRGTGEFVRKDGSKGASRYIDTYVRSGGAWKVVSAQITRSAS